MQAVCGGGGGGGSGGSGGWYCGFIEAASPPAASDIVLISFADVGLVEPIGADDGSFWWYDPSKADSGGDFQNCVNRYNFYFI